MEKLKGCNNRKRTQENYLGIWRNFNDFLIRLDTKPNLWEERTALFLTYMIDNEAKSSTIKSYKSAIKSILVNDNYEWNESKILLSCLTRACRIKNDIVRTKLPIQKGLMELILFEIERIYINQPYLEILYKAVFALSYYRLLRIGEVAYSDHTIQARNVHIGTNKNKIMFVLYSSKTHGKESRPQKIKIQADTNHSSINRNFCPFNIARNYLKIRGNYKADNEQFFVFSDNSPLKQCNARSVLKSCVKSLGLDYKLYSYHGIRAGRCTDLIQNTQNFEDVKRAGRWRSNTIYKYLKL